MENVPNQSHKQSQFTSKFILTSRYFQIWWIAPYYAGLLIGSGKKANFAGFLGANSRKHRPILRHFRGNVWGKLPRKSISKNGRFCGYFLRENFVRYRSVLAHQTSIFNVFLTGSSFALSTTVRSRNETMAKALTSWLVPNFHNIIYAW